MNKNRRVFLDASKVYLAIMESLKRFDLTMVLLLILLNMLNLQMIGGFMISKTEWKITSETCQKL